MRARVMKKHFSITRRQFLKYTTTATVTAAALPIVAVNDAAASSRNGTWKFCAFEKPLQFLSYDQTAELMAELGFNGVEATVRPGGHVLPERVEDDLPKFVEALKKRGLEMVVMTTAIGAADQPHAEKTLRTAARLGIKRYRMNWWRYELKQPIQAQLDAIRPRLKDLVALNHELGLTGLYQNHAGPNMVGAPLWDIYSLIRDYDRKDIALAFDIRHSTVEGGLSWPIQFNLVKSHIGVAYLKDFDWENGKVKNVPLGEGRVDKMFVQMLKTSGFDGPISIHVEYLDVKDRKVLAEAFKQDLATARAWLAIG